MRILVPVIAALVPVIITPGLLFHFDITPKVAVLLYGVAAMLIIFPKNLQDFYSAARDHTTRAFLLILAGQLVWMCVSTGLSPDRSLSVDGSEWRRLGLTTWVAVYLFAAVALLPLHRLANVATLLRWSVIAGALVGLYTISQYFGLDPILSSKAYLSGEGTFAIVRPPGTLGHADYVAAYLVFLCFASIALSRMEIVAWRRYGSAAVALVAAFAIFLTGTRGALAALVSGAMFIAVAEPSRLRRRALGMAIGVMLVAAFVFSPAGGKVRARLHWVREDAYGGARLLLWRDTLRMSRTAPFVGFGPEAFVLRFPQFQSIELARAYPDFFHESPHNIFLDTLAAEGVPGLILLAAFWAVTLYSGWKVFKKDAPIGAPLLACAVALLIAHQFTVFVPATAAITVLVQVVLVAMQAPALKDEPARTAGIPMRVALAVPAVLLVIAATRITVADYELKAAQRSIASGDAGGARAAYALSERWQPRGGTSDLYYSRAMAALAAGTSDPQRRAEAWREALRAGIAAAGHCEQRQNAWYSLASLFAAQGDSQSVERCLREAIAWAPNWFKPHWTLAQLLELQKRRSEAIFEAGSALDRNGGRNAEVVSTWLKLSKRVSP